MASEQSWYPWVWWRRRSRRIEISMDVTPGQARDFLSKLATEDKFRMRVESDPRAVLAEYDIHVKRSALPRRPIVLPPREEIEALLDRFDDLEDSFMPLGYGWLVVVLAFAMPLVPGDAPEADAPG